MLTARMDDYFENILITIPAKPGIQWRLFFWIPDQVRNGIDGCLALPSIFMVRGRRRAQ
jgi:hypothetical protein